MCFWIPLLALAHSGFLRLKLKRFINWREREFLSISKNSSNICVKMPNAYQFAIGQEKFCFCFRQKNQEQGTMRIRTPCNFLLKSDGNLWKRTKCVSKKSENSRKKLPKSPREWEPQIDKVCNLCWKFLWNLFTLAGIVFSNFLFTQTVTKSSLN